MGDSDPGDMCLGWETSGSLWRQKRGRPQWWEAGPSGGRPGWPSDTITSITGDHSLEERGSCGEGRKNHRM